MAADEPNQPPGFEPRPRRRGFVVLAALFGPPLFLAAAVGLYLWLGQHPGAGRGGTAPASVADPFRTGNVDPAFGRADRDRAERRLFPVKVERIAAFVREAPNKGIIPVPISALVDPSRT